MKCSIYYIYFVHTIDNSWIIFSLFVVVFVVVTSSGRFIRRSKILDWDRRFVVAILLLDLIVCVCVKKRKKREKESINKSDNDKKVNNIKKYNEK